MAAGTTGHAPVLGTEATPVTITSGGAIAIALLRLSIGFVFLWAFLDKLFGLGYATPGARAWINGGSPTKGFLSNVDIGRSSPRTTRSRAPGGRTRRSCWDCWVSAWPSCWACS